MRGVEGRMGRVLFLMLFPRWGKDGNHLPQLEMKRECGEVGGAAGKDVALPMSVTQSQMTPGTGKGMPLREVDQASAH